MGGYAGREAAGELQACTTWPARAARSRSRLLDSRGQGGAALTARVSRRCRGMQAARRSRRWRLRGGDRRRGWVCTRGGRAAQPWHDTAVSWGRDRCKAFTGRRSRVAFAGRRSPWRRAGSSCATRAFTGQSSRIDTVAAGSCPCCATRGASLREVAWGACIRIFVAPSSRWRHGGTTRLYQSSRTGAARQAACGRAGAGLWRRRGGDGAADEAVPGGGRGPARAVRH